MKIIVKGLFAISLVLSFHNAPFAAEPFITVASTTSTQNSGLFKHILPLFKAYSGINVRVVAVGTGQAIRLAKKGDSDVLFVHHKPSELKFVRDGFGVGRKDVMYNDIAFDDKSKNMLDSINILEKAKISKATDDYYKNNKKNEEDVWDKIGDFFNPFKCGK